MDLDFKSAITDHIIYAVSVLIVLTNTIEIILLVRARRCWYNAQILFLNLALADTALGCTCIIAITIFLSLEKIQSLIFSIVVRVLVCLNIYGSSYLVTLLSVDRWIATKWPLKYRAWMTKKKIFFAISFSWVLSGLCVGTAETLRHFREKHGYHGYLYMDFIITVVQTLILVYLYYSIFLAYRKSAKAVMTDGNTGNVLANKNVQGVKSHNEEKICVRSKKSEAHVLNSNSHEEGHETARNNKWKYVSLKTVTNLERNREEKYSAQRRTHGTEKGAYSRECDPGTRESEAIESSSVTLAFDAEKCRNAAISRCSNIVDYRADARGICRNAKKNIEIDSTHLPCGKKQKDSSNSNRQIILDEKIKEIPMSNKERRLLKLCCGIVMSFAFSYVPPVFVIALKKYYVRDIPDWLYSLVVINALCGSLWNPFLYFLHQFFSKRKT